AVIDPKGLCAGRAGDIQARKRPGTVAEEAVPHVLQTHGSHHLPRVVYTLDKCRIVGWATESGDTNTGKVNQARGGTLVRQEKPVQRERNAKSKKRGHSPRHRCRVIETAREHRWP